MKRVFLIPTGDDLSSWNDMFHFFFVTKRKLLSPSTSEMFQTWLKAVPSDLDALVLLQQYQQKDLTKGRFFIWEVGSFYMGRNIVEV